MKRLIKVTLLTLTIVAGVLLAKGEPVQASSPYHIKINKQQNCVTIYAKDKDGKYTKPVKAMICSTGYATPLGTFSLKEKIRWHVLDGPVYGQYCSRINGHVLFHSVWYYRNGQPNTLSYTQFNNLGKTVSHGCVRICTMDAKWIYENCPSGTQVTIYNAKNPGPLGRPTMPKLSGYMGWDPTDVTNKDNPFNKKKPSIKGTANKVITFASVDNILKGVKVKNTVGNDAKKLLNVTIKYKNYGTKKYKKVKKVNTRKPGIYKITYKITDEIGKTVTKKVTHKVLTLVKVKSFVLNRTKKTIVLGKPGASKTFKLKAKMFKPTKASIKEVAFSSSNTKVASVNSKGVVKAKGVGTATIYVRAIDGSGIVRALKLTVNQMATGISLNASKTTIAVGGTVRAQATVAPSTTSNKKVTFSSSNSAVASVDANGLISGKSAGTAVITAKTTDGSNKQYSLTITVKYQYASSDVSAVQEQYTQALGTTATDIIALLPEQITIKDLTGKVVSVSVSWEIIGYSETTPGNYTIKGTYNLPNGWMGSPEQISTLLVIE